MSSIEKVSRINNDNLSEEFYFQSLLQESYRVGVLGSDGLEKIQLQMAQILSKVIKRYTHYDSSSVKIETAEDIMNSVCYSIGIWLKNVKDNDAAVTQLKEKPLDEIYRQGQVHITELVATSMELFRGVQASRIETRNDEYNVTLMSGIPSFFKAYDREFGANETPGSIDYPISGVPVKTVGIEYIHEYLKRLLHENQFCRSFLPQQIHAVMKEHDPGYEGLLVNIYEVVSARILDDGSLPDIPLNEPQEPEVQFVDGEKMDDDSFRKFINELSGCRYASDKVKMVHDKVHSFSDLLDILKSGCLFGDEFTEFFNSLEDTWLAMLLKEIPSEMEEFGLLHLSEDEKEWQSKFTSYYDGLDAGRHDRIGGMVFRRDF